ncbi:Autotransporter translocation and assembly factor TamB [Cohaesibacter sp. ES.047]|uniref:translocation/assembly module TamB domain-containing protein n=1 Tax=Cohaesibacter sp. ES.047 TaxID=1798205 RepID=UPI000BB746FF|nr:translocation/assembly module TamB domain-containing protein [Cohaesibacter sp. ES.047]SNY90006.1 Autotransporter translocation and assembly factor TamB [Cohaesibacter sp. ES.047]
MPDTKTPNTTTPGPTPKRSLPGRLGKRLLQALVALVIVILFGVLVVLFLLGTSPGRGLTVEIVNSLASSDEQTVEIAGLDSALGSLRLSSVRLSDADGIWLEAKDFSADYSLASLLAMRLDADHITLGSLEVVRPPVASTATTDETSSSGADPLAYLRAKIDRLAVGEIKLGAALLGKPATLTLDGNVTIEGQPLQLAGAIDIQHKDSSKGYIKGNWDIAPSQNRRQIDLDVAEPRGGLIARLLDMDNLPALRLTLAGDGSADDWRSDLEVSLDGTPTVTGEMIIRSSQQVRRVEASLNGKLAPFLPTSVVPLVAGDSNLTLALEQDNADLYALKQLRFTSGLASLDAAGTVDIGGRSVDLTSRFQLGQEGTMLTIEDDAGGRYQLGFVDVTSRVAGPLDEAAIALEARLEQLVQGSTELGRLQVKLNSEGFNLEDVSGPLDATATIASLTTGTEALDKALAGPVNLSVRSQIDGSVITLDETSLATGLLTAGLTGSASASTLDLDGRIGLSGLERIDPQLAGSLAGDFTVSGSSTSPELNLEIAGEDVAVAKKAIEGLKLTLDADAVPNAAFSLVASYDGSPLKLAANLVSNEDGSRDVRDIILSAPGGTVEGAVAISPAGLATGDLDAKIASLKKLGPLLLQPDLEGSLEADIALRADEDRQNINVTASAATLSMPSVSLSDLALEARIRDATNAMGVEATVSLANLNAGGERVRNLSARMEGDTGTLPFSLDANVSNAPMTLKGVLRQSASETTIELSRFSGKWKGIALALSKATSVNLTNGATLSSPLVLKVDSGTVTVSGEAGDKLDLKLAARNLPLSIADKVAPTTGEAISGSLNLDADISGTSAAPRVKWNGNVSNLSARSMRAAGVPAMAIDTNGSLENNQVRLNNVITGGGSKLTLKGGVALSGPRLDLSADGTIPFSLAARTLADAGLRLNGNAAVSARVTGSATNPSISGSVTTQGARLIELSSGLVINNLSGTVRLSEQTARLEKFSGTIGKDGSLSIAGTVGIDPAQQLPADITLTMKNVNFRHEDILNTLFDADLKLKGKLATSSVLSGRIDLRSTEIMIPETLPQSIPAVSVQHKNAEGELAKQVKDLQPKQSSSGSGGSTIGLDLTISSPRRIYVRGRGIDAELGGTIKVLGTTSNPNPVGTVSMQRGRMDLLTKRLDFDRGSLGFAGSLDPSLDFAAVVTNSGRTYTMAVGGYASDPNLSLTSSPSMPEDEILAQLFFDRPISDLSPLQIAQLANAVATISGANSGPGLIDRLRNLAGIDNIDIKSDEKTGETTVGVGRYLNDKTYVNVEKGTSSDSGKVTIDLELTGQVKARGEADTSGRSKAGIFFEQDY